MILEKVSNKKALSVRRLARSVRIFPKKTLTHHCQGLESTTVEDIYNEIRAGARKAVPDDVKRELLEVVQAFIRKEVMEETEKD